MQIIRHFLSRMPPLPMRHALPIFLGMLAKRAFHPFATYSYSQFGEDRALMDIFQEVRNGVYVDVGCNHPISYSNTFALYLRGWSGLTVDAIASTVAMHRQIRTRDHSVCAVVSDQDAMVEFFQPHRTTLTAGVGQKNDGHWRRTVDNSTVTRVRTRRLDSLLLEHRIEPGFELLCVDVEGYEMQVLNSLDLVKWKPKVCLVEIHGFDIENFADDLVVPHMRSAGYRLIGYLQPNAFFASGEFARSLRPCK
jgi:FkbM family methyltransferase